MENMTPEQRRSIRRDQVERCLATDMTVKEWCALNKVPRSTMYAWMARFREEEPDLFAGPNAGRWIEISKGAIASKTALAPVDQLAGGGRPAPIAEDEGAYVPSAPIVVHINGADVVVPSGADDAHMQSVLRAVAAL